MNPDGTGYTVLKWFDNPLAGAYPYAGVTLFDNRLYGTTYAGGISNYGTVFSLNPDGTDFVVLKHFLLSDGANPYAKPVVSGDTIYGTTYSGGSNLNYGTVFSLKTNGTGFTVLKHFASGAANPTAGVTLVDDVIYGTTLYSSFISSGSIYKMNKDGSAFSLSGFSTQGNVYAPLTFADGVLYGTSFSNSPAQGTVFKVGTNLSLASFTVLLQFPYAIPASTPYGGLVASGSRLYGTSYNGGNSGDGTIFSLGTNGGAPIVLKHFAALDGRLPYATLLLSGTNLFGTTYYGGQSDLGTVFKVATNGTGFSTLVDFTSSETSDPSAGLTTNGSTLFGTTRQGGDSGIGAIFKIDADGAGYSILKYFTNSADGAYPSAALTLSNDTLYGTAWSGGDFNGGTVFKLKTDGTSFAVLKSLRFFTATGVILAGNALYGTTYFGGTLGQGTVFKLDTDGTGYSTLFEFAATNGYYPSGDLILSGATLYGTTAYGGSGGNGTVFKVDTNGANFAVLKHLTGGAFPMGSLTLSGSTLYGTTSAGGSSNLGSIFKVNTNGSGFVTIFSFANTTLVGNPGAGLVVSGTTLYGTAYNGRNKGRGAVFKLNTDGTGFAILKNFTGPDGATPQSGLTFIGTRLYGTTRQGGGFDLGTIFSLELAPIFTSVVQSNGTVELSITGEPRKNYTVYATTNFAEWEPLGTVSNATGSVLYTDEQAGQFSSRFYRAVQSP